MVTALLGVVPIDESKTAVNIAKHLRSVCMEWGLTNEQITGIVTDHGANIVAAVKSEFGEEKHLPCFAHTINLVAGQSVPLYSTTYSARDEPVIDEDDEESGESAQDDEGSIATGGVSSECQTIMIIKKMKKIIKFFKCSETGSRKLREVQMKDGAKESQCLSLVLDVRTRWNSIMYMIERFLSIAHHVSIVLLDIPKSPVMLTGEELNILKEVRRVLQPLESVTAEMSGEKYVTSSKVIPLVRLLKLVCIKLISISLL